MTFTKKSWTPEEEEEMMASLRQRKTFEKIALHHDRSVNAIKLRFGMVCRRQLETTTKTLDHLCQEYHIPENRIVQYMEDLETIQKKNQTLSSSNVHGSISPFDLADITIIKEQILVMNEKLDKMYRHVKKLTELSKQKVSSKKTT